MLLRSLKLTNFRQYKAENKIYFSGDKEKNVTVILGKNTGGKTTIVQAFNWALYGEHNFKDDILLNLDIQNEMNVTDRENVEVEIQLTHDKVDYTITRCQEYLCNTLGNIKANGGSNIKISYVQEDGQTEPIKETKALSIINDILPIELSEYFFFDGERIGNISNKQGVFKAVKDLTGLNVLCAAMEHIDGSNRRYSVVKKLKGELDLRGDSHAEQAQRSINLANMKKQELENKIKTKDTEIEYYTVKKQELEQELRDNKNTSELQKRKELLERMSSNKQRDINDYEKRLIQDFSDDTFMYFSKPLAQMALKVLLNCNEKTNGVPEMHVKSIEHMIARGFCLCGCNLKEGSSALENLLKEKELLPPNSIGTIVRQFKENTQSYSHKAEKLYDNVIKDFSKLREAQRELGDMEEELKGISRNISGTKDMKIVEQKLSEAKEKLKTLQIEKDGANKQIGMIEKEIEEMQKIIDKYLISSNKNESVKIYLEYAQQVYNWFAQTYNQKEQEIKEKLVERVNSIFNKMYHGKRIVEIDDKYKVSLLTTNGQKTFKSDESRGLETVKNFAFIGGLVDLAREKILSSEDLDENQVLSSEPYPLVMDAPFSNADEIHVTNISNILPQIAEQVIMVVMEKDWSFAEKSIGGKVGKKYVLDKRTETLTKIQEVQI